MRKIENPRIKASEINPGTIVRPFIGAERFDVTKIEVTPQGSVKLIDTYRDLTVEMASNNHVEILGYFNL